MSPQWGLDWATLHGLNPSLIYTQITGFAANTSMQNAPGFGKVGEARSGVVHLTGFPGGPPVHTGLSPADTVTAMTAAYGILATAYRKAHDPEFRGEWIDLALFEPLFRLVEWQVIVHDQLAVAPRRSGNRLAIAPAAVVNTYLSGDDEWITVTSATVRSVQNVARLLGLAPDDFQTGHRFTRHDRVSLLSALRRDRPAGRFPVRNQLALRRLRFSDAAQRRAGWSRCHRRAA